MRSGEFLCDTPEDTLALGERLGEGLVGGELILLHGGLGVGKTLMTKGILNSLDYDVDEVTSPSFALVNLYESATLDVYHIDLWRLDGQGDLASMVGLDEILESEKSVTVIEWADRLGEAPRSDHVIRVYFEGDGDEPRHITIDGGETSQKI